MIVAQVGNVAHGPLVLFTIQIPANDLYLRLAYKTTTLYSSHKVENSYQFVQSYAKITLQYCVTLVLVLILKIMELIYSFTLELGKVV